MILAWENREGGVSVTRVVDDTRHAQVLSALIADGHLPNPATVIVEPIFPDGPRHQWRIRDGAIVVDPTIPDPSPTLRADLEKATTIAGLKAVMMRMLDAR